MKGTGGRDEEGSKVQGPGSKVPGALIVRVPRGIRSKEKLLAVLADKLRVPRYFGWNWDALEECLRDLSWLPADQPVVLVHEDLPFGAGGENRDVYLAIMRGAAEYWARENPGRLEVVLPDVALGGRSEDGSSLGASS